MEAEAKRQLAVSLEETFSAASVSHVLAAVLRAPAATVQLIDWLNARLPQLGLSYQRRVSLMDRTVLVTIESLRSILILITVAVLGAPLAAAIAPASSLAALYRMLGEYWWVLAAAGAVAVIGLGRILDALDTF